MTDKARRAAGWPPRMFDAMKMRVRTLREFETSIASIPRGTIVTITDGIGWERLTIRTDACERCGVRVRVIRVSWRDLDPNVSDAAA